MNRSVYAEACMYVSSSWKMVYTTTSKNPLQMKLVAKDNVQLTADGLLMAAQDHNVLMDVHVGASPSVQPQGLISSASLLKAFVKWSYVGEIDASEAISIHRLMNSVRTSERADQIVKGLEDLAVEKYDSYYDDIEMRVAVGKGMIYKRVVSFIQRFAVLLRERVDQSS